jgi:allophanate hydrolase
VGLAVVGAHLSGMALNHELTSRGATFVKTAATAPAYRLYALPGGPPRRPGLVRSGSGGTAIAVEVWALAPEAFGEFVACVPAPLCIGTISLGDGTSVKGFLCEPTGLEDAEDITRFGGWREYIAALV